MPFIITTTLHNYLDQRAWLIVIERFKEYIWHEYPVVDHQYQVSFRHKYEVETFIKECQDLIEPFVCKTHWIKPQTTTRATMIKAFKP